MEMETPDSVDIYKSDCLSVTADIGEHTCTIMYRVLETPTRAKMEEILTVSLKFIRFYSSKKVILIFKSKKAGLKMPCMNSILYIATFFMQNHKEVEAKVKNVCIRVKKMDDDVTKAMQAFKTIYSVPFPLLVTDNKNDFEDAIKRLND